jgi:hypothetical protein
VRITRYPSLTEAQFKGCISAFVDSLAGELNVATAALRRLEGRSKGGAFAFEMEFDTHRYGALIVLDRWSTVVAAFGPHIGTRIVAETPGRVRAAEDMLAKANAMVDAAEAYRTEIVEACALAFRSASGVFQEEREEAERNAKLGPMLSEEYREARQIFLADLAAR